MDFNLVLLIIVGLLSCGAVAGLFQTSTLIVRQQDVREKKTLRRKG